LKVPDISIALKEKTSDFFIGSFCLVFLSPSPAGAVLAVLDHHPQFLEPVANGVRERPQLLFADLAPHFDQQVDEFIGPA
jgi:hypothetical protein